MDTPSHERGLTSRIGGALAVCVAALALSPALAMGSTITILAPTLSYSADNGEANAMSVSRTLGGDFDIVDLGAVIVTPDCSVDAGGHHAVCPSPGIESVNIALADQDDELTVADLGLGVSNGVPQTVADGGPGNDSLTGLDGSDGLIGGAGADVVSGGSGADAVYGGAGPFAEDDEVDGADVVDGGPGDDLFVDGGPGADHASGGSGDDPIVTGADGDDVVTGGPGDDSVVGGTGDDRVQGGDGADRIDVPASIGSEVSRLDAKDVIGRDTLEGDAGDDVLGVEGPGPLDADVLRGGDGADTVSYAQRLNPVSVSLDGLPNDGEIGEGDNVSADVEVLTGGSESDTLMGSVGGETIDGGPGDDFVDGLAGDDHLAGGAGDSGSDSLLGGAGADTMLGGPGDDSLAGGADRDDVRGGGGSDTVVGDDGADLLAGGPGLDTVEGGAGDDALQGGDAVLIGADGADQLDGGAGDDSLDAGPGNDLLDGGPGADRIRGEAGRDTVTYETRAARVAVTFDGVPADGEHGEGDNVASDVERVVGSGAADTLTGDGRDNALTGGSGEDLLAGRGGADTLRGGTAPDVLDARDGVRDTVDCGPARDLAILDRIDNARNCEFQDLPSARRPRVGRTMRVVRARRGSFRLPDARRFVPLRGSLQLPLGTTIDARPARVHLTTGRSARKRQTAVFAQGAFSVRQTGSRRPITDIRLRGGDFSVCNPAAGARAGARRRPRRTIRRVWGQGRGHYRTRGRHSSGVVRGTTWLTVDRCDGTLTRVYSGTVVVTDFTLHRTVVVHAGQRYLARAPRGS
jgi:Ca2+-binding RTX toxin-like protein